MNKKSLLIIIGVIVLAGLGFGAFWYFSKNKRLPIPAIVGLVFPNGSGVSSGSTGPQAPQKVTYTPGSAAPMPRLYELHTVPVAGVGFFETGKGVSLLVKARYIERGLGNIFESSLSTFVESRISNETRPKISEALWGNNGKSVVIRFLADEVDAEGYEHTLIKSRIINLSGSTLTVQNTNSTNNAQSVFLKTEEISLPDYIPFVSTVRDNSDKLFYLVNSLDSSSGYVTGFKNLSASNIFNSSFKEWLPQYPSQKLFTVTTKPSADVPGYLFFVDPVAKSATKILGNINGLTTLTSPDGSVVLYSETQGGLPSLSIYNVLKKETKALSLQTLPEKCVWSLKNKVLVYCAVPQSISAGIYPDQWYQGVVSFSDALWEINTATQATRRIMSPAELNGPDIDMTNLAVSSNDTYLLFMSKASGTPWVYRIADLAPTAPIVPVRQTALPPVPSVKSSASPAPSPKLPVALPSAITPDMQKIR